jgi:signal transduction histidine kinase
MAVRQPAEDEPQFRFIPPPVSAAEERVMKNAPSLSKKYLVGGLVIIITILHYGTSRDSMTLHVLHRELYFLPILLSGFWFGRNAGFMVALLVSFLYSSYILTFPGVHGGMAALIPQVFVFILIGTTFGWLADKERTYQKKRMIDRNIIVLGKAAGAVAYEIKTILKAMRSMFTRAGGLRSAELDQDFEGEMNRLHKMTDILTSYTTPEPGRTFSHDINSIIKERVKHFQKTANKKGVIFVEQLDPDGCPSWIDSRKISWVLDQLIKNALEVSASGDTVYIKSARGADFCTVSVKDEGPGIKPEHLKKIFTPFFTTKPDGHGLALAGCRKSLHDMGGDISVKSTLGDGAGFTLKVPREYSGKSLAEDTATAVLHGKGDSQFYRE